MLSEGLRTCGASGGSANYQHYEATSSAGAVVVVAAGDDWRQIHAKGVGMLIEHRPPPVRDLVVADECCWRFDGAAAAVAPWAAPFGEPLAGDIAKLAARFAATMNIAEVRVRLEVVTGDACRRWHHDYADVRLVTTFAGRGTEYIADGLARSLSTGPIALFKGRLAAPDEALVLHRSPPLVGTGERRLVLVIDTPRAPLDHAVSVVGQV